MDPCEVLWTLRKYYPHIKIRLADLLCKFADSDNNGVIDRKEFNRFASILEKFDQNDEDFLLKLIFKAADLNDNGKMEKNGCGFERKKETFICHLGVGNGLRC